MAVESHTIYKVTVWLWKLLPPLLILFGTIGNILVVIVLTRKKFKKTTISVFLITLAVSDLLVLNTGLLRQWITYAFGVDIRVDLTESGCRFHWFIVYVTTQYSSWMLICVTTERTINTIFPHKLRYHCTFNRAYIAVGVILASLIALNTHYLFGYGSKVIDTGNSTVTKKCEPLTSSYEKFIIYDWTWIDLCVFYLVPMLVLITGNSIIIYKVIKSHRRSRTVGPMPNSNMAAISQVATMESQQRPNPNLNTTGNQTQDKKVSSLTVTLMLVSTVFIICITPIVVYPIGDPYWKDGASEEKQAELFFWESTANIIMYVNNSINCVLYFFSGSKFRDELKRFLCRPKYAGSSTAGHSNTMGATSMR